MKIVVTMIVVTVGLMLATNGFADHHAKAAMEAAEPVADEMPAVESPPPDAAVTATETEAADASETESEATEAE